MVSSSWTSRKPTVVRVVTVWYRASSTVQPSSTTNPAVPAAMASPTATRRTWT
jgi:hypothetical protein